MANKLVRQYIRQVSWRMPVNGKHKQDFLDSLQETVTLYVEEHPDADLSQLTLQFGTADDIAADFIAQMSYRQITEKFRARNRVVAIVTAIAIALVISWGVTLAYVIAHEAAHGPSYIVIAPAETDP